MNRKPKFVDKRNDDILNDFATWFYKDMIQLAVVYARLSAAYYLDPKTIARIVSQKKKELRENPEKPILQEQPK